MVPSVLTAIVNALNSTYLPGRRISTFGLAPISYQHVDYPILGWICKIHVKLVKSRPSALQILDVLANL